MAIIDKYAWSGLNDLTAEFTFNIEVYTGMCEDPAQTFITPQHTLQSNLMTFKLGSGLVHNSWYEAFFESN